MSDTDADAVVVIDEKPIPEQPVEVFKSVMLHPKAFFKAMPEDGPLKPPLTFLAIVIPVGSLGTLLSHGVAAYFPSLIGQFGSVAIFAIALTFLGKFFGGKQDLRSMLRACCYASAPTVLHLVPIVGTLANFYGLFLMFLGVRRTQGLSGKNSALTVGAALVCGIAVSAIWHMIFRHGGH